MVDNALITHPYLSLMLIAVGGSLTAAGVIKVVDSIFGKGTAGIALAWSMGIVVGSAFFWEESQRLLFIFTVITGGMNPERF
jgi:hypothetical protein